MEMPVAEKRVKMTVELPKSIADRVAARAASSKHTLNEEMRTLLEQGLRGSGNVHESVERARKAYEAELIGAEKTRPTTEELWEQMRRIREEVANELYPE